MCKQAISIISALGGTTAVARAISAPITTVQSWKANGIPPSRLEHLKLVAKLKNVCLPIHDVSDEEIGNCSL